MWRLQVASDSGRNPLLETLNGFAGRLTWEWDPKAGSAAEREHVEAARRNFEKNRHSQQHSADVLYRSQFGGIEDTPRRTLQARDRTVLRVSSVQHRASDADIWRLLPRTPPIAGILIPSPNS